MQQNLILNYSFSEPTFVYTRESLIKFISRGYTVINSISKDKKMSKGIAKILK